MTSADLPLTQVMMRPEFVWKAWTVRATKAGVEEENRLTQGPDVGGSRDADLSAMRQAAAVGLPFSMLMRSRLGFIMLRTMSSALLLLRFIRRWLMRCCTSSRVPCTDLPTMACVKSCLQQPASSLRCNARDVQKPCFPRGLHGRAYLRHRGPDPGQA